MTTINKHTAIIDGVKFTRDSSSGRVYAYCIVVKVLVETERKECETNSRKRHKDGMDYNTEILAGGHKTDRAHLYHLNRVFGRDKSPEALAKADREDDVKADVEDAERIAKAQEYVKTTVEERVAKDLADYDAMIAASKNLSPDRKYHYLGGSEWCGRLDLAEKAVGKWMARGEHAIAVPATVVQHTPKARKAK